MIAFTLEGLLLDDRWHRLGGRQRTDTLLSESIAFAKFFQPSLQIGYLNSPTAPVRLRCQAFKAVTIA
jgi:hypothetical protein